MKSYRNLVVIIITITVAALIIAPSPGRAQVREIITEGIYTMGDGETPLVAESRALLQAKRKAIEHAGTYVESYSKVNKITLTKGASTPIGDQHMYAHFRMLNPSWETTGAQSI